MESLEKIILPTTQVTKCTTGLTLHKLSLDRCPYVLLLERCHLTFSNKQYETDHGKQTHANNVS